MLRYVRFGFAVPGFVVAILYGAGSFRCLSSRIRSQPCGAGEFGAFLLLALPVVVVSILLRVVDERGHDEDVRPDALRRIADLAIACSAIAVLAQWMLCR